jgi:succinate dehydrogenase / fumarate reductase cytochrome b subunit
MGWITQTLNSSIGKKFIMAITGILLLLFLIVHLVNNLLLFVSPDFFNENVVRLESIKPIIRVVEILLAILFIYHIYNALKLWFQNKRANPVKYAVNVNKENSTLYSRWMVITGVIIFIFLIIHLSTFWATYNFGMEGSHDFYGVVAEAFANPIISLGYFLVMIFIGFHLNHAFQSAFQTFGWNHNQYTPFIKKLGTFIAILITIGFASIPVYFYLISTGGGQ